MKHAVKSLLFLLSIGTIAASAQNNNPQGLIQHVMIVQENRTPDNLFGSLPTFETGVNIKNSGNYHGTTINFGAVNLTTCYDLGHSNENWVVQWDGGLMDGEAHVIPGINNCTQLPQHPAYQYLVDNGNAQVTPYFAIAQNYGFANYMFQTNQGPSFPAHQFLFSGTSALVSNDNDTNSYWKWFAAENMSTQGGKAGCVASQSQTAEDMDTSGNEETSAWYVPPDPPQAIAGFPCYSHNTMVDVFNRAQPHITWKYYTQSKYGIWTAPVAIDSICKPDGFGGNCKGSAFPGNNSAPNVILPAAQIFNDIQGCTLPQVSWVTPDGNWSDHPGENADGTTSLGYGASWVADIINLVGENSAHPCNYWNNTVILVTWDDWGGWQDHVFPPLPNAGTFGYWNNTGQQYVYGFRVPLLVVSAYTPAGYVSGAWTSGPQPTACPNLTSSQCHDFGSILNFIEYVFGSGGSSLGQIYLNYPYADYLALDSTPNCQTCTYSLSDFFNFNTQPRTFTPIPNVPIPTSFFTTYTGTVEDPDNDAVE